MQQVLMERIKIGFKVALFVFVIAPVGLILCYTLFVKNFLPSFALQGLAEPIAYSFGLIYLLMSLPVFWPQIKVAGISKGALRPLAFLVSAPIIGVGFGLHCLGGGLPYLLHIASNSTVTSSIEVVKHVGLGGRGCSPVIELVGDRSIFRRRLCGYPLSNVSPEDRITLFGSSSKFGFLVTEINKSNKP